MPSEAILQLRITKAAEDAIRAVKNRDQAAYAKAVQRYHHYDGELRKLEKVRNERAVAELEQSARRMGSHRWLSYEAIERSGVPQVLLEARGWEHTDYSAGMRRPTSGPLRLIPTAEPQGTKP